MSIILKGIDLPKEGEWLEVIIKPSREVIVDTIRYKDNALLKTEYKSASQIPKGHGRLIDADELVKHLRKDPLFDLVERYGVSGVIESRSVILEAEEYK